MARFIYFLITVLVSGFAHAGVTPWIPFELDHGNITIPVTVAGIKSKAILDTGANANAINQHFIEHHKLQLTQSGNVEVEGAFGRARQAVYNNVDVELFGMKTALNVSNFRLGTPGYSLLIGAGFFNKFVIQIDYPNRRMRMTTRDVIDVGKHENIKTQAQKGTGYPIVQVEMAGKKVWLLLDTGSSGGITIGRRLADGLDLINPDDELILASGANTIAKLRSTTLGELTFGPFTLSNVKLTYPEKGQKLIKLPQYSHTSSMIKGRKVRGIVGFDVLKHFLVTLDYARGHMHLSVPEKL
ncbi:aspartyl protease family protein [Pseudoalteromonas rubra]|uniref:Signal protein PDZ n=1 Tax=Pseudoalteromonas rubra TaxID=43658 RepID=A0A0F4QV50_9GAMM|nr:aspartyl protease family protein [Pseudoalteromonas rubra]KJZ11125.1 hypothetical protein TW77_06275 [Pseudoalteromonas rubra]